MNAAAGSCAPRHVVLIALDGLGDLVLRQPLLTGLLDRGERVSVVVRHGNREIAGYLDRRLEIIVTDIDPHAPVREEAWSELATLTCAIAEQRPDVLVAAAHNRTYVDEWLVHQFPACVSIGFANPLLPASVLDARHISLPPSARRSQLFTHVVDCAVEAHETEKYGALFQAITGEALAEDPPAIALDDERREAALTLVRAWGLEAGQYAIGCPMGTSTVALKAWPAAQYGELAAHLADRHGLPVVLVGNASEAAALEEIARAGDSPSCGRGGSLDPPGGSRHAHLVARGVGMRVWTGGAGSLGTLLGLIALSRLYVGNDTGPMHLAGALGVPVVARFGGGHWPRFVPMARRAFSATQQLPCAGCGWSCWLDDAACMKLIETQTFVDGIDWVLSGVDAERRVDCGRPLDPGWSETFIAARNVRRRLEADLADIAAHATARLDQICELTRTVDTLRRRRLRLAVNLRTLQPDKIGGLEEAFRQVLDRLLARHGAELEVTLLTATANAHAFEEWRDAVRCVQLPDEGWEDALSHAVRRADVLWCPLFFLEPLLPDVPSVVTMPDLQHDTFPEFFTPDVLALRLQQCRLATAHASRVVTLSEHSRRAILRRYGGPEEHVTAIPLDAGAAFRRPADPARVVTMRERYGLPHRYGLFPANTWPHKNHRGVFQALARYRDRYGDPPLLVLTGASDVGGIDLAQAIADAGVGDVVRHLGYVDRDEMPDLYDGATFLAFVSLYEGFGIPVVEAFRRGTPLIAANTTSLPEIAGDGALLVDPRDPDAIADAMHAVLTDPAATRARVARAYAHAERFSYDEAAESMWRVLQEVAAEPVRTPQVIAPSRRPKVLVVTPSFNQGRYLRETIDSVLHQDYGPLDYVVADGGSTDESVDILRSYGDRVRWTSGPDGGQAAAIAQAWRESDADIVAWLNSDDTYLDGAITAAVDYLLAHPETAMVYGQAWYTDADGWQTSRYPTKPFDREALAGECFVCQPAVFLRREVLDVAGLPDASLRYGMDYDLWIRVSQHFRVGYLERMLATSRMHAENKTLGERDGVFREVMAVAQRHFGVVHPNWINGYVEYQMGCDPAMAQLPARAQRQRAAVLDDGIRSKVIAPLHDDGWAGRRTVVMVDSDDDGRVTIACDCPVWPHLDGLTITASCEDRVLATHDVQGTDPFVLAFQLSTPARTRVAVLLEASDAVIPLVRGLSDEARSLSFRVLSPVVAADGTLRAARDQYHRTEGQGFSPGRAAVATASSRWIAAAPPGERERLQSGRPKVSIVTPSFNQARFLEQTLRSVLEQDYPDLEYIVIDGGSTDGSVEILQRYADRLAYWVSEPDGGQTDALNKGFARATGDLVAWLNSDDVYYPGAIAAAVAAFQADPELGLVYGRGNRIDQDGELIGAFEWTRPFDLEALTYGVDYILQPTVFMRRQTLHDAGPFDPGLHYAFDWDLWIRLGTRVRATMLDRVLAAGREYATAKTFTGGMTRAEEIRRIVHAHTGQELTVGTLTYALQTMYETLPRTEIAAGERLGAIISEALGVCRELLDADRLRDTASTREPVRVEIPVYADGWAGPEIRVRRALPAPGDVLCLTGVHDETLASIGGPLRLWAFVDDRPLGLATVEAAGPFTADWRVPAEMIATHANSVDGDAVCDITIVSATSAVPSRFGPSDDVRSLAFQCVELRFRTERILAPLKGVPSNSPEATMGLESPELAHEGSRHVPGRPDRPAPDHSITRYLAPLLRWLRPTQDHLS